MIVRSCEIAHDRHILWSERLSPQCWSLIARQDCGHCLTCGTPTFEDSQLRAACELQNIANMQTLRNSECCARGSRTACASFGCKSCQPWNANQGPCWLPQVPAWTLLQAPEIASITLKDSLVSIQHCLSTLLPISELCPESRTTGSDDTTCSRVRSFSAAELMNCFHGAVPAWIAIYSNIQNVYKLHIIILRQVHFHSIYRPVDRNVFCVLVSVCWQSQVTFL